MLKPFAGAVMLVFLWQANAWAISEAARLCLRELRDMRNVNGWQELDSTLYTLEYTCEGALREAQRNNWPISMFAVLNNRAVVFRDMGRLNDAVNNFLDAARIDVPASNSMEYLYDYLPAVDGNRRNLVLTGLDLSWETYRSGEIGRALFVAYNNVESWGCGHYGVESQCYSVLGHIYAAYDDPENALDAFVNLFRSGDSGLIRDYQEALWEHGYYEGTFDGRDSGALRSALQECLDDGCRILE